MNIRDKRWWKKPEHYIPLALTIGIPLLLYWHQQSSSDTEFQALHSETSAIKSDCKDIKCELAEIQLEKKDDLLKEFPVGYALFGVDKLQKIVVGRMELIEDYAIDWAPAGVKDLSNYQISIRLPDITYKPRGITFEGCSFGMSRQFGDKGEIIPHGLMGNRIFFRLLSDTENGITFVIGFADL